MLYNCILIIIIPVSCKDSIVDPKGGEGFGDERILFTKYYNSVSEICTIKPDGTDLQIIASNNRKVEGMHGGYLEAKWSPDKDRIVVTTASIRIDDSNSIWLMDNEGNIGSQLTSDGFGPNWSGDGNTILFSRSGDFNTINISTMSEFLVLQGDDMGSWGRADWSSDGKYLLTEEDRGSENELYRRNDDIVLLDIFTAKRTYLTDSDMMEFAAQWSPDESEIAYTSGRLEPGYQIKLMNSDGSSKTTLVDTLARYNSLCWSPDCKKIVFNKHDKLEQASDYAKGSDLFVLDINSSAITQLTHFNADSVRVSVQDWK
jgi:Tol biopolymer transport system component